MFKSGIHIDPKKKGTLRKALGVKEGETIPASKLAKAKNSKSAALRKKAVFAENAKHWNHTGSKKKNARY